MYCTIGSGTKMAVKICIRINFHRHSLLHGQLLSIVAMASFSSAACTIIEFKDNT